MQDIHTELTVAAGEAPKRLDVFLTSHEARLSRSTVQRLIGEGRITVNGQAVKASYKIRPGDRIVLEIARLEPLELKPEPISLDILYEDEALLVLHKPPGLVVHPAPGHWSGTLVNALLHHFGSSGALSTIGGMERPGLVHRLDKETSGVMVIAKTDQAHPYWEAGHPRRAVPPKRAHASDPSTPGSGWPSSLGRLDLWRAQGAGGGRGVNPARHAPCPNARLPSSKRQSRYRILCAASPGYGSRPLGPARGHTPYPRRSGLLSRRILGLKGHSSGARDRLQAARRADKMSVERAMYTVTPRTSS